MEQPEYYECHVTLEPVFDEDLELLKIAARAYGFQVADLLMQRRKQDTPVRSSKDTFCTAKDSEYESLFNQMNAFVDLLEENGFKVWRRKIESVLYDERTKSSNQSSNQSSVEKR